MSDSEQLDSKIGFSIRQMPDCLYVCFEDLPLSASTLTLCSMDMTEGSQNFQFAKAVLTRPDLAIINRTGVVAMPFLSFGRKYAISAVLHWPEKEFPADRHVETINFLSSCRGIHVTNKVAISLHSSLAACSLSDHPVFSSPVSFLSPRYTYSAAAFSKSFRLLVGASDSLSWSWDFHAMETGKAGCHDSSADGCAPVPAYVDAACNISYMDVPWEVGIASTGEFAVRLRDARPLFPDG